MLVRKRKNLPYNFKKGFKIGPILGFILFFGLILSLPAQAGSHSVSDYVSNRLQIMAKQIWSVVFKLKPRETAPPPPNLKKNDLTVSEKLIVVEKAVSKANSKKVLKSKQPRIVEVKPVAPAFTPPPNPVEEVKKLTQAVPANNLEASAEAQSGVFSSLKVTGQVDFTGAQIIGWPTPIVQTDSVITAPGGRASIAGTFAVLDAPNGDIRKLTAGSITVISGSISSLTIGTLTATSSLSFSGSGTSTFTHIVPALNNTYDLGSPSLSWRDTYASGSLRNYGHVALGNKGQIDAFDMLFAGLTARSVLNIQEEHTDLSKDFTQGITNHHRLNPSGSIGSEFNGINTEIDTLSTNFKNYGTLSGNLSEVTHSGGGTVGSLYGNIVNVFHASTNTATNAFGFSSAVINTNTGTVGNLYGVYIDRATNHGGGTIDNAYGLFIRHHQSEPNTTNAYNIYSEGENSKIFIDGPIGVATTTPQAKLHIRNTSKDKALVLQAASSTQSANIFEYWNNAGPPNGTLLSWISASGGLGASGTSFLAHTVPAANNVFDLGSPTSSWRNINASGTLRVNGTIFMPGMTSQASSNNTVCIDTSSFELERVNGTCAVSSRKYKHDIEAIDIGLETILKLRPVSYKLNENDEDEVGLIAEEVLEIEPRLIYFEIGSSSPRSVKYGHLTAVLIKAIQEQNEQINELKNNQLTLNFGQVSEQEGKLVSSFEDGTIIPSSKLIAVNGNWEITADGRLKVKKVLTDELEINAGGRLRLSFGADQITGIAALPAGFTKIRIENKNVEALSIIHLTPKVAAELPLAVTLVEDGAFEVSLKRALDEDISFWYLVISPTEIKISNPKIITESNGGGIDGGGGQPVSNIDGGSAGSPPVDGGGGPGVDGGASSSSTDEGISEPAPEPAA